MAAGVSFRWYQPELNHLLRSASGPVGRRLATLAAMVETASKGRCPVDTGRLRSSITWRLEVEDIGLVATIGTSVEYAGFVHNGTRYMAARPFLTEGLHAVLGGA